MKFNINMRYHVEYYADRTWGSHRTARFLTEEEAHEYGKAILITQPKVEYVRIKKFEEIDRSEAD